MCCCSSASGNPPPPPPNANNPPGCTVGGCAQAVTVTIQLSQPVACPGHPLAITAVGTPGGGTYAWTVSGASLVDGSGSPVSTGPSVNLRGFSTDTSTGKILEQNATVSVTYTHPNGTASDSKPVKIHKIDFDVAATAVHAGVTQANESAASLTLGSAPGVATMWTDPTVKINLDPSCPRKGACAGNHRVGWLQAVTSHTRSIRYRDSLGIWNVPVPIRDSYQAEPVFAFASYVKTFAGDRDTQTAHHEDSPNTPAAWTDPRHGAPAPPPPVNGQLRQIVFQEGFSAWLVVQNIEWGAHDVPGSMAYQKHMDWSLSLTVAVDATQPVHHRCTPQSSVPNTPAMADGKGGGSPVFGGNSANNSMTWSINPAAPPV